MGLLHGQMSTMLTYTSVALLILTTPHFTEEEKEMQRDVQVAPVRTAGPCNGSWTQAGLPRGHCCHHGRLLLLLDAMSHSSAFKIAAHCYRKPFNHRNICWCFSQEPSPRPLFQWHHVSEMSIIRNNFPYIEVPRSVGSGPQIYSFSWPRFSSLLLKP